MYTICTNHNLRIATIADNNIILSNANFHTETNIN